MRLSLRAALGALLLLAGLFPLAAGADPPAEKVDALLKTVLLQPDGGRTMGRLIGMRQGATDVKALVKVTDGGAEVRGFLWNAGGRLCSRHGEILVLELPYRDLPGLASLASVARVEADAPLMPTNDLARQPAGAHVDAVVQANPQWTGKGVLVGVLDSGVDTSLPAFRDAQGRSRILHFWKQSETDAQRRPTVTLPEGGTRTYGYGSEYTAADLDAGTWSDTDPGAHGTHVAGTIAGRDARYPGVAPEARLLVVANDGPDSGDMWRGSGTGSTLDAYEFLLSRAREIGLPLVVNQSQGTLMGPHDGSTLFEQALQADVDSAPRNLIACLSAGNDQDAEKHARVEVPADGRATVRLAFDQSTPDLDRLLFNSVDLWLREGRPAATLRRYTDDTFATLAGSSAEFAYAAQGLGDTGAGYGFTLAKELPSALNGDDRFLLTFQTSSAGLEYYELELRNDSGTASTVDLYLQRNTASVFLDHVDPTGTLGIPGTTPGAITVGAYKTRASYVDLDGNTQTPWGPLDGELTAFSSLGPPRASTRYRGLDATKPDVAAPGSVIMSQMSTGSAPDPRDIPQGGGYRAMSGTSMSAPVVTGLVALILQDKPDARVADVKALLFQRARADAFTGAVPNSSYGHGKVDADSLSDVVSPTPSLTSVSREGTTLVLRGANFAVSGAVLVNGVPAPADRVDWIGQGEIRVALFPEGEALSQVSAINLRAPEGRRIATWSAGGAGAQASESAGGGGCFVATAAFGTDLEPEVMALRRFRDRHLLANEPGRWLVGQYYRWSPPAARAIADSPTLRAAARLALRPVVFTVQHPGLSTLGALALVALALRRRRAA